MDGNLYALGHHEARVEQNEIDYEKMLLELTENILDDSEESESSFNLIVNDYGFEYSFSEFIRDEL